MELTMTLISRLSSMMLYVVVGYIIVKIGLLKSEDSKPFSKLVVYVLQPCLIVHSFQIELTPERLKGYLAVLVFSTLTYILWIALSAVLRKTMHLDPIDQTTLVYSNVGNLVLPLVSMILGDEMVFYASAVQIPFNFFIWTHGYQTIRGEKGVNIAKIFKNSNVIAVLIGIVIVTLHIHIPEIPETAIEGFTSMVGPASMMVVGMVITDIDLKSVFTYKKAWPILLGRLILFPCAAMGLLFISGFLRHYPVYTPMIMVGVMALSAPPASTVSQLAVVYDIEPIEASIYNVLGTFLCIVTMPAIIMLFQMIFPG
ncbi:MAG: AEC family transporter [Blautia sp.]|nr:AEC family transporter [Blautia sp.]